MAMGDGGHKPCVQTFAADQFDDKMEDQREAKSSFFNWWYLAIVLAGTSSVFLLCYLERIGVGLFFSIVTMVVSALVEGKRVAIAKQYNLVDDPKSILPMSVWLMLPQYTILGTSEAFTVVGLQELFYDPMPEGLRSLGAAAAVSLFGVGSFMANAIIDIVMAITSGVGDQWLGNNLNKAHLDYYYWLLAGLSALNLCVYLRIANGFVYKKLRSELK
ncbi:hypothetical protein PIB30_005491 [Stylosanthes scabra]|uniref:Uncharacterized protein n=1 Tax=Stylosanthes scabra TaxID=79078 RepID=A0ABU6Z148_9FABA|nr:hypothetical protein [Stylosanthes scabra]